MTFIKESLASIRRVDPLIYCSIILFLVGYVSVDVYIRSALEYDSRVCSSLSADALALRQGKLTGENAQTLVDKWNNREDRHCGTILGHLPMMHSWKGEDPWKQMKWVGKPARCRVKGHVIESLDDTYNFRRGYALKYVTDVEDKTYLLPWLLGSKVDLNLRERRVFLDLGGNMFNTSVQWFMRMYPCDFTEVHVFEIDTNLFRFPEIPFDDSTNVALENIYGFTVNETPGVPNWMVDRMKLYNVRVSDADNSGTNSVNITRFIKETLRLTAADTVVVKMDIEGSEWGILKRWMDDPDMAEIIDELFVEIHYANTTMAHFGCLGFHDHTREQALHLLAGLRSKGFFVHAWP